MKMGRTPGQPRPAASDRGGFASNGHPFPERSRPDRVGTRSGRGRPSGSPAFWSSAGCLCRTAGGFFHVLGGAMPNSRAAYAAFRDGESGKRLIPLQVVQRGLLGVAALRRGAPWEQRGPRTSRWTRPSCSRSVGIGKLGKTNWRGRRQTADLPALHQSNRIAPVCPRSACPPMTAEMTEGPPELGMSDSLTPSRSAMRFMASRSSEPWNIYVRPLPSFWPK